ncbi:TPA: hypothetical protein ACP32N_003267 [Pseudomonas aeruginosa]
MSNDTTPTSYALAGAGITLIVGAGITLIVGAVARGAYSAIHARSCSKCSSIFLLKRKIYHCASCDSQVCEDCSGYLPGVECCGTVVDGGSYCSRGCLADLKHRMSLDIADIREEARIVERAADVRVHSHRYKTKAVPRLNLEISTSIHDTLEDAEWALQLEAARHGCQAVFDTRQQKHPSRKGNYRFNRYSLSGII